MSGAPARARLRDGLVVLALGLCALALRHDGLQLGFSADDYAQLSMIEGRYPIARAPLELFTFSDGSRREAAALAQSGVYPWFVDPQLKLAMWRPLSCALIWLDHALFGHWALGYHLHSALWWLCSLLALFALLERLLDRSIGLLALLFFALDESQGALVGWIAQRNAIVSTTFIALALGAYVRFRQSARTRDALIAAACACLALLGGEYALSMLAYAAGYELWLARDPIRVRVRSLAVLVAPALFYVALRSALGFGARGSGMYVDPIGEAPEFLAHSVERFPALLSDLVLGLRADFWTFGAPWTPQLVARGLLPQSAFLDLGPWRHLHEWIGWIALPLAALLCVLAARLERAHARAIGAFATGALLAMVPLLTTLPSGRVLVAPQLGWSVVLAALLHGAYCTLRGRSSVFAHGAANRLAALVALACAALHLTLLPAYGLLELGGSARYAQVMSRAILSADLDPHRLPAQRVLLVQAVDQLTPSYFSLIRSFYGAVTPRSVWTLSPSPLPVVLRRTAVDTLELHYPIGGLMHGSSEPAFRKPEPVPEVGARFALNGMRVQVLERRGDTVSALRFVFEPDLDRPSWQLLVPTLERYARVPMPAVGGQLELGFAPLPTPK